MAVRRHRRRTAGRLVCACFGIAAALLAQDALAQRAALPPELVPLDSATGRTLLLESTAQDDFWPLAEQFVSQERQSYCGVASSVMVLNALEVPAPAAPAWQPYRAFTQENVFTPAVRRVRTPEEVSRGGMTLAQLGALLEAAGASVRVVYASDSSLEEFRRLASDNLGTPGDFVVINYLRSSLHQSGEDPVERMMAGHISPLGAYSARADRFLVMDVARYKFPPVWVSTAELWSALNTNDLDSGRTRGYLLVSRGRGTAPMAAGSVAKSRVFRILLSMLAAAFVLGAGFGFGISNWRARRRTRPLSSTRAAEPTRGES